MFYITRMGCARWMLPHDSPPWGTMWCYFRTWRTSGLWELLNARLREQVRRQTGHRKEPRIGMLDSQCVRTSERGFDAGQEVQGRKRHVLVDTLGLVLSAVVHRPTPLTRLRGAAEPVGHRTHVCLAGQVESAVQGLRVSHRIE